MRPTRSEEDEEEQEEQEEESRLVREGAGPRAREGQPHDRLATNSTCTLRRFIALVLVATVLATAALLIFKRFHASLEVEEENEDAFADDADEATSEQGETQEVTQNEAEEEEKPPDIILSTVGHDDKGVDNVQRMYAAITQQHEECERLRLTLDDVNNPRREYIRANCGFGYSIPEHNDNNNPKSLKIALTGTGWSPAVLRLSGCPPGNRYACPQNPQCRFAHIKEVARLPKDVSVVMLTTMDALQVRSVEKRHGGWPYKVLHWREAVWPDVSKAVQQEFDFEMGVHFMRAGILNPIFISTPRDMILRMEAMQRLLASTTRRDRPAPLKEDDETVGEQMMSVLRSKPNFALSIMSDCSTDSKREYYMGFLTDYLGADRVHRYGACGDRKMPRRNGTLELQIISRYKFYFAFENSIQNGYVTEKLFNMLSYPVVPVYLGSVNAPNITRSPSIIKASDFASPKELAQFLLNLDADEEAYLAYHKWRLPPHEDAKFDPGFLSYVAERVPGPRELLQTADAFKRSSFSSLYQLNRRAACCRLCDENVLAKAKKERASSPHMLVEPVWPEWHVRSRFFGGKFERPGKKALLPAPTRTREQSPLSPDNDENDHQDRNGM